MKRTGKLLWLPFILLLVMIPITSQPAPTRSEDREGETILVGRISHVEGEVLRYVPDQKDWAATVKDAPFGMDDALYSGKDGRAEIIMPNNTWARIDGDTQVQLIALKDDVTEIDVASGVARFYNKGSDVVIKATTPFGYVMAPAKTSFDLYVGDDSAEVISLKGRVDFVHNTSETRFEVIAGSSSILADSRKVTAGEARKESYWHAWNGKRDTLWAKRMRVRGKSVKYLPPRLHHEAYVLDEYGRWERVYSDGTYRYFWRPVHVSVGWAPFTVGRWTVWYGDHTWIPYEPFGYITHHYGAWVFAGGFWYWAPPVPFVRVHIGPPLLPIPFFWYPGRVAWIHFGVYAGWFPLGPHEHYYCHRRWGPHTVVVKNVNITKININIRRHSHVKRAVIIHRNNFYRVNNYGNVRIRHIRSNTIAKNYRVAPVVDNRVIKNYKNIGEKYNFTNVNVTRKPHRTAINRIKRNQIVAKRRGNVKAKTIRHNVKNMKEGRVEGGARIRSSKVKERVVPVNRVNRPVSQGKFEEGKLKTKPRSRTEDQGQGREKVRRGQRRKPPRVVKRQEVQREDQGQGRRKVQKVQRRKPPRVVKRQEVQRGDQRQARSKVQRGQRRIPPRPEQQVREGQKRRKTTQDRQLQQWQQGRQKNRSNGGREGRIGRGSSRPDSPAPGGTVRSRSRLGPGKGWIRGKNPKVF
jgi:hypothetical protein